MYRARLIEFALNQNRGEEVGNLLAAVQHRELAAHLEKLMHDADIDTEIDSECSDDLSVVSFETNDDDFEEDNTWARVDDPREGHLDLTDELCDEDEQLPHTVVLPRMELILEILGGDS